MSSRDDSTTDVGYRIDREDVIDDFADWGGATKTKLVRFVATKPE